MINLFNKIKIGTELSVLLTAMVPVFLSVYAYVAWMTILAASVGVLFLAYVLKRVVHMKPDSDLKGVGANSTAIIKNQTDGSLIFNENNKAQTSKSLDSKDDKKNLDCESNSDLISLVTAEISTLFNSLFRTARHCSKSNVNSDELSHESTKCSEEAEIIGSEIEIITAALNDFNQQVISLNRDLSYQPGFFHVDTDQTALLEPVDPRNRIQMLRELRELMGNYPKWECEGELTLEYLQLYSLERLEHHEKVKSMALVLLPELGSLLNEGKIIIKNEQKKVGLI